MKELYRLSNREISSGQTRGSSLLDTSEEDEELTTKSLVDMAIEARDKTSTGIHDLDNYNQVLATLSMKSARKIYGQEISDKATTEELQTCIQKDVW
jgi:hypothetical protein